MSDPLSVLAGIAGVAAVGVQLSLSLYEISNRLINAPREIAEVASELSSLATILKLLGSTLESSKRMFKEEMETTARETIARFEILQKDVVGIITKASHIKHLRWLFTSSRVRELMVKVHTVKSSLQLLLSIIQLAIVVKSGSKRTRRKNHQMDQKDLESYHRRLAESFAEATRQTIKELCMQQIYEQRASQQELLVFRHWTEPTGQIAAWLYHRTLSSAVLESPTGFPGQRVGHAKTVKTHNPDVVASDSDYDEENNARSHSGQAKGDQYLDSITEDEEELLFRTGGLGKKVVDNLLHQWTNLSEQQIMESGNATSFSKPASYQVSIEKMIRATIKDELDSGQGLTSWRQSQENMAGNFVDVISSNSGASRNIPPTRTSLGSLNGLTIQPSALIQDDAGVTIGKLVEGNAKKLSRKKAKCDRQGNAWLDSKIVGRVEAWDIGKDKEMVENFGYPEAPEAPGPYSPPPSYPGAAPLASAASTVPTQILSISHTSSPTPIEGENYMQNPLQTIGRSDTSKTPSTQGNTIPLQKELSQISEGTNKAHLPYGGISVQGGRVAVPTDDVLKTKDVSEDHGHEANLESSRPDQIFGSGNQTIQNAEEIQTQESTANVEEADANGFLWMPPLSVLDPLCIETDGTILNLHRDVVGRVVQGDAEEFASGMYFCDKGGNVIDDTGKAVGKVETVALPRSSAPIEIPKQNQSFIQRSGASYLSPSFGKALKQDGKLRPGTEMFIGSSDNTCVNDGGATGADAILNPTDGETDDVARKVKFVSPTGSRPGLSTQEEPRSSRAPAGSSISGLTYSGINETIVDTEETSKDEELAGAASVFAILDGKPLDIYGDVYDDKGRLIGKLSEGNMAEIADKDAICDARGKVWRAGKLIKGAQVAVIEENLLVDWEPHEPRIRSKRGPAHRSRSTNPRKARPHDIPSLSDMESTVSMRRPANSSSIMDPFFYDLRPNFDSLPRSNSISQFDHDWALMPYHPFTSYPPREAHYSYHPMYHNQGKGKELPPPPAPVAPIAPSDEHIAPLREQIVALQLQMKQQELANAKEREEELRLRELDLEVKLKAEASEAEQERRNRKVEEIERMVLEEQKAKSILAEQEAEARSRALIAEDAARKAKRDLEEMATIARNAEDAHRRAIAISEEKTKQAIRAQESGIKSTKEEAEAARKALIQDYEAKLRAEIEAKCKAETAKTEAEDACREAEDARKEAEKKAHQLRNAPPWTETMPTSSQLRYASLLNPNYGIGEQSSGEATSDYGNTITDDASETTETTQTTPRTRSGIVEVNQADLDADPAQRIIFPRRVGWKEHEFKTLTKSMSRFGFWPLQEKDAEVPCVPSQFYEMPGSGGCGLRGTALWHPPGPTLASDLYTSLLKTGWKPTYVRCNEYGETWFLGRQPVHVIMFTVNYIPQATIDDPSQHSHQYVEEGKLYISKEWVEKDTLDELGYGYSVLPDWRVSLDPKLTHADIETAVARSFLLRETRLRKKYRDFTPSGNSSVRRIEQVGSDFGDARSSLVSLSSVNKPWRLRSLMSRSNSRASGAFQG